MNILVSMDDVLSSPTGEPIRAGVMLYYALNTNNRVALRTARKTADAEQWLQAHGIVNYDDLIDASWALEGEDLKRRQFVIARSRNPIEMYVDADPAMIAWVFETQGVTALMFAHPDYLRVEGRPDAPAHVRTWGQIEEAVNRVNIAKSKDKHLAGDPSLIDWE